MLVSGRVFHHCRDMNATLMGKSRCADIRRVAIGRLVQQFIQQIGNGAQGRQVFNINAGFKTVGIAGLEQEGRNKRHQIGIAAAFAQTVNCAL